MDGISSTTFNSTGLTTTHADATAGAAAGTLIAFAIE